MGIMTIDGQSIEFTDEPNVLSVIRKAGIDIPTLCYHSELSIYGACRLCTVENDRGKTFASCSEKPKDGMVVYTNTPRLMRYRKLNKKQAREEAIEALRKVGIPSPEKRLDQYPHEFSGGMRQRVLIAMALCCKPKLLIADEPTTALDVPIQAQILELLKQLRDEEKMSVVLITHDLGGVASLSNRISVMYGGLIMEEGLTDEIFYAPKHPYTRALLHAIPQPTTGVKERLEAIPGMAPSLTNPPAGCPFAERCKYACEKCESEIPAYRQYTRTQRAMCVFTEEELNAMDKEGKADGRTE